MPPFTKSGHLYISFLVNGQSHCVCVHTQVCVCICVHVLNLAISYLSFIYSVLTSVKNSNSNGFSIVNAIVLLM